MGKWHPGIPVLFKDLRLIFFNSYYIENELGIIGFNISPYSTMKIAHLILVHAKPQMLKRLVNQLKHNDADIYIQLDAKADFNEFADLEKIPSLYFIKNRVDGEWGNYSLVEATLAGFEQILNSGITYSHINLLSGQDYPLKPVEQFHKFLAANPDKTFMHSLSVADDEWLDGKTRFVKYSFGDYKFPGKYHLHNLVNAIFPKRKLPGGLRPYGKSQWFTMTPECARYVIDTIKNKPALKRYFRMTWCVDEVFFQTILKNSPLKDKLVNDNLRFIDLWGNNRPTIFKLSDADMLIASGKFFARKFDDDVDTAIFDRLDEVK